MFNTLFNIMPKNPSPPSSPPRLPSIGSVHDLESQGQGSRILSKSPKDIAMQKFLDLIVSVRALDIPEANKRVVVENLKVSMGLMPIELNPDDIDYYSKILAIAKRVKLAITVRRALIRYDYKKLVWVKGDLVTKKNCVDFMVHQEEYHRIMEDLAIVRRAKTTLENKIKGSTELDHLKTLERLENKITRIDSLLNEKDNLKIYLCSLGDQIFKTSQFFTQWVSYYKDYTVPSEMLTYDKIKELTAGKSTPKSGEEWMKIDSEAAVPALV